jgi:hypothetical protein
MPWAVIEGACITRRNPVIAAVSTRPAGRRRGTPDARDLDRQVAEFQVRVAVLNGFAAIGTPITEIAAQVTSGDRGCPALRRFVEQSRLGGNLLPLLPHVPAGYPDVAVSGCTVGGHGLRVARSVSS